MYEGYFGLTERPFSIAPDPQYLYMSARHKEAMAHLSYGLAQGGCFIVLTGEVGTGKTTLCRNLLRDLPDKVDVALILNANINETELLQTICDELEIEHSTEASQKQLLDSINTHLLATYADNRQTVLIIDEAQLLSRDVLEQIRLLTNLETTKQKLLQIILIGQPELNDMLLRNDLRQLAQRVTARYHLGALERTEIKDYINFRLSVAGCKKPLFSKQALNKLHSLSEGIPRKINVLADHALLGAYSRSQQVVDARSIKAAADEVFINAKQSGRRNRRWLRTVAQWWVPACLLLVLNLGLWWWLLAAPEQDAGEALQTLAPIETVDPTPVNERPAATDSLISATSTKAAVATPSASAALTAASEDESVAAQPLQSRIEKTAPANSGQSGADPRAAEPPASVTTITSIAANPGRVVVAEQPLSVDAELSSVTQSNLGQVLEASADQTGRVAAFRRLAQSWGAELPAQFLQPACQILGEQGLRCLGVSDWTQLQRYNRPAILVVAHGQQLHRVIVTGLDSDTAQVLIGSQTHSVPVAELRDRWTGNGLIFWRPAALGTRLRQLGDESAQIPRLRAAVNAALIRIGLPPLGSLSAPVFDLDLSQKVFVLQNRYGLLQDSKVGHETYLLLNEILQAEQTPVLVQRVGA